MKLGNPGGKFSTRIFPGAKFNRLAVVRRLTKEEGGGRYKVLCLCKCGNHSRPSVDSLLAGTAKSCGCLRKETLALLAKQKSANAVGYGRAYPGALFGRMTVIERIKHQARCKCRCGTIKLVAIDGLINGNTKSCGCLSRERVVERNKRTAKHKQFSAKYHLTYATWRSMLNRCYNRSQQAFPDYGGAGVRVCSYLKESPWNFLSTLGERPTVKHTLDRFPVHDGNYTCGQCDECKRCKCKLNVRWATRKEQALNRGDFNVYLAAFGKVQTLSQWGEETGLSWDCLTKRLKNGWSTEKALSMPSVRVVYQQA